MMPHLMHFETLSLMSHMGDKCVFATVDFAETCLYCIQKARWNSIVLEAWKLTSKGWRQEFTTFPPPHLLEKGIHNIPEHKSLRL